VLALAAIAAPGPEDDLLLEPNVAGTYLAAHIVGMVLRLSTQARRALELLDGFQDGVAEEFLICMVVYTIAICI